MTTRQPARSACTVGALACIAVALVMSACGPLIAPMPTVLSDEQHAMISKEWARVYSPPDRLDPQSLLDLILTQFAYHIGMDRITYRAEKDLPDGTLVIEVEADALGPAQDSMTVTLLDADGAIVRKDVFLRADIERTHRELGAELNDLRELHEQGQSTPAQDRRRHELERRLGLASEFGIARAALPVTVTSPTTGAD